MKTSTEHLPPCCREELRVLRSLTVRHIPDCCLIILGGSHAGQDYVPWSESVVRGRHTLYRHDYEIAVFVEGTETKKASRTLRRRIAGTYDGLFRFRRHTTPRFIVESVGTLTEQSKRGHLFSQRPRPQRHPAVRQRRARSVRLRAARSAPSAGGSRRRIREIFSRCGQSAVQRHDPAATRRKLPAKRPAASRGLRQVLPHRMDGTYESFSRNAAARRTGRTGQALLPRVRRNFPLP